jgi:hypothetical protein
MVMHAGRLSDGNGEDGERGKVMVSREHAGLCKV